MRIAGAAPPDVAARVGGLGLELGVELARALARHRDLDAGLALERGDHHAAPFLLHRAIEHQRALRLGGCGRQGEDGERSEDRDAAPANMAFLPGLWLCAYSIPLRASRQRRSGSFIAAAISSHNAGVQPSTALPSRSASSPARKS